MPERSEKAQERVREELEKNPEASTKELQEAAQSVDPAIAELSLRQFNAGYVLPLKRSSSGGRRKGRQSQGRRAGARTRKESAAEQPKRRRRGGAEQAAAPGADRDRVRNVLMEFARDFSEAESRTAIVGVLSELDRYVDRIVGSRE